VSQGLELCTKQCLREREREAVKAVIFFVHGYDEHCHASYQQDYALRANQQGYDWFSLDFPGHGLSQGTRDLVDVEEYLEAYAQFIEVVMGRYKEGTGFWVSGLSMGGGLSILLGLRYQRMPLGGHPVLGLVLLAPAIHNSVTPPVLVTWILRTLVLKICPLWRVIGMPTLGPELVSRFPKQQQEIRQDTLRSAKPVRLYSGDQLLLMGTRIVQDIPLLELPFLVIHGDDDRIVPFSGSLELLERAKTPPQSKALRQISGGFHDAYWELEALGEADSIFAFMDSHVCGQGDPS
jgi:acylglycerol lipase